VAAGTASAPGQWQTVGSEQRGELPLKGYPNAGAREAEDMQGWARAKIAEATNASGSLAGGLAAASLVR
jgi:hypothetical protein